MSTTEYRNDIFELRIVSEVGVHLLPPTAAGPHGNTLLSFIERLNTEADVIMFKAEELTPTTFSVEVEHGAGTYRDHGELVDDVVHVTWPDTIGDAYQVKYLAKLFELRALLASALAHFHPTLIEVQFL